MIIRNYSEKDISYINEIGSLLHEKYEFSLDDFSSCLVLEENDLVIGFIIYSIIYERAEIVDLIIDPDKRRNGYGEKLINYAIDEIIKNNCQNITLEVNCVNYAAVGLYKKVGFEIEAVRKNYYNGSDGYLMKKDLR